MEQDTKNHDNFRASWTTRLGREIYSLGWNLLCGLRLLVFRGSAIRRMAVSYDQLFLLVSLYIVTVFVASYYLVNDPQFDVYGFGVIGAEFLAALLVGYLMAKISGDRDKLLLFLVVSYCVLPFFYLIVEVLFPLLPSTYSSEGYIGLAVWSLAISLFICYIVVGRRILWALMLLGVWFLASLPGIEFQTSFWYEGYGDYEKSAEIKEIDTERVFYSQPALLDDALNRVKPGKRGVTDLFFVGFGAYASQDVFMKEIGHIQQAVDTKLGTSERSLALINHRDTLETLPLASSTNLGIVLKQLGKLMNPDEDVLFLYLTSHGSRDHDLAVDMWPLKLNDVSPDDLKVKLDDAGIRWRIILVSACYSGGFIKPLMDEYSLILTASAADKTSFGCSNANEFTYFGEALFKDMGEGAYRFIPGFQEAIERIAVREKDEKLEPSEPQLYVSDLMLEKLQRLEAEMAQYPAERFANRCCSGECLDVDTVCNN